MASTMFFAYSSYPVLESNSMSQALVGFLLVFVSFHAMSFADELYFPPETVIDVRAAYGAQGDGKTDDTAAIHKAIREHLGKSRTLYFPSGVYMVSDRLEWNTKAGQEHLTGEGWQCGLVFQGAGESKTTLQLIDGAPGYNDPSKPKGVIHTASGPSWKQCVQELCLRLDG
jgi:hypothetical protein